MGEDWYADMLVGRTRSSYIPSEWSWLGHVTSKWLGLDKGGCPEFWERYGMKG